MKFGSVCSGIESASVAWDPLGMTAAWFSEIEPFPCSVLSQRFPHTPNLGDMTLIDGDDPSVFDIDVLIGGTPCQGFSVAGLQGSLDDDRSNLALSFCRLGHTIAAHGRLKTLVWENVPGCLSTHDNAFGCILAGFVGETEPLQAEPKPTDRRDGRFWKWNKKRGHHVHSWANAGCVYGPKAAAAWRVLDAQYQHLAQRRERVFVVVCFGGWTDPAEILFERHGVRRDSPPSREAGEGFTHDVAQCLTSSGRGVERGGDTRGQDPVIACTLPASDGGVSSGMHPVIAVEGVCGTLSADTHPGSYAGQDAYQNKLIPQVTHALKGEGHDASEDGTGRGVPLVVVPFDTTQCTSPIHRGKPKDGDPCHTLNQGAHPPAIAFRTAGDGAVYSEGDCTAPLTTATDPSANIVAFSCKDHGADAGELSPTLRAMGHDGSHANAGGQVAVVVSEVSGTLGSNHGNIKAEHAWTGQLIAHRWAVRRLLPVECERLQGFPDGWTNVPRRVFLEKRPEGAGPCAKQIVTATVVATNGAHYVATNHTRCPQSVCPRKDMPTGVGYELCRDVCQQPGHAELNVIKLAKKKCCGATLYIEGHTYACEECKAAAVAAGIVEIKFEPPPGTAHDGPRYKAIGNSKAVPVVRWIGKRILAARVAAQL